MLNSAFVHLHVHSEYSLLDGAAKIKDLTAKAAAMGMTHLALTDHGVMYGAIPFYKACRENGIEPIIGCEVYFTSGTVHKKGTRKEQPIYHLVLLAQNEEGYRNLLRLTSKAHLEGFHYKPRVDEQMLRKHSNGLICLSACLGGEVSQHLLHDRWDEAKEAANKYKEIFEERFYLELQDHGLKEQRKVNQAMVKLSATLGIPLIVTNDVHYLEEEDASIQDVLICIGTGKTLDEEERLRIPTTQMYLKSAEEMAKLFPYAIDALENTVKVAKQCKLKINFGESVLPEYDPIPDGLSKEQYLWKLCEEGLKERYPLQGEWSHPSARSKLEKRLRYELEVISSMGYSDYFLIVWDFIRYAHEQGIVTGPGRGSSAGSLVAYVLKITNVDPMKYGLLFERFLNPERVTMPDIDIDFNDLRRDEVIEYVVRRYGVEHVAQIISFGTLAARAAVRDVGRVMRVPIYEVDRVTKLIPHQVGMTIERALETNRELKKQLSLPHIGAMLETAKKVEGMPRHASTHAAGVVISKQPLTNYVPLQEGTGGIPLTQYSMEHLEDLGLLKMDFLGLRTLSIIERTCKWIEQLEGKPFRLNEIPLNDAATYEMLGRGDTTGVFQLESTGMRRVLREMKPTVFEDIISVLALYRPGPMEFIPQYIRCKHGKQKVSYPHASLIDILQETYGIIVYQEQIMQIASKMAGFTLGEADLLRRAVSKKKREILDKERKHFVEGSVRQGYTEAEANQVYDMIVKFANYGFPKAHATAYGVLAFQTAYLKAHYPGAFMAAMLTAVTGNQNKTAEYVEECKRMGIEILPPDVNESGMYFTPVISKQGKDEKIIIRFGLAAVKNVGQQAIESILTERQGQGKYTGLLDFCRKVDLRVCNKRVIECLIQTGAMDTLPGHRAQLIASLDEAVELAVKWKKEKEDFQLHLFGFQEEASWELELPDVEPYDPMQQLALEKEMTGLYISGHPLDDYSQELAQYKVQPLHALEGKHGLVTIAGLISHLKPITTKNGKAMAFAALEDRYSKVELIVFPDAWSKYAPVLSVGSLVLVKGKLQKQENENKMILEKVMTLSEVRRRLQQKVKKNPEGQKAQPTEKLYIKIASHKEQPALLKQLQQLLRRYPGSMRVILFYEQSGKSVALNETYAIRPEAELLQQVERWMGEGAAVIK